MPRHRIDTDGKQIKERRPNPGKSDGGRRSRSVVKKKSKSEHSSDSHSRRSSYPLGASQKEQRRVKSTLRVKTQFESIKHQGLVRKSSKSRARISKAVEFAFLEVREYPMIL